MEGNQDNLPSFCKDSKVARSMKYKHTEITKDLDLTSEDILAQ